MTHRITLLAAGCSTTMLIAAFAQPSLAQTGASTGADATFAQPAPASTDSSPSPVPSASAQFVLAQTGVTQTGVTQTGATPTGAATTGDSGAKLGEIVVTAQRRRENLQQVPISVTAIGGTALKTRGIEELTDLGVSVSGAVFQRVNGIVLPFLRGVGNTGNAAGNEPSVATYIDGVYFPRTVSSFFDLKNVDQIEVLKGPQGTLFGRNSTGGVINVITLDPSHQPSGSASVSYGRFDAAKGDFYGTTGLTQNLAVDFSFTGKTDDGFGKDIATGDRYGYEDSALARSKLLWTPDDDTRVMLSGFYSYSKQSSQRAAFPGLGSHSNFPPVYTLFSNQLSFFDGTSNPDNADRFQVAGGSIRIDQKLGFANLVNITAYSKTIEHSNFDFDFLAPTDGNVLGDGPTEVFTQELQLVNKPGAPFDWIVGTYYYNNETGYSNLEFLGPAFGPGIVADSKQRVESFAGYGQATVEILPKLKLTGGLRYTHDNLKGSGEFKLLTGTDLGAPPAGESNIGKFTYRAALDYQFTHDISGYASFNHGFKSGNFGLLTYNRATPTQPEEIDAYEVGFKTELFDRRLRLNGAGFRYDISNPQVALIDLATNTIFFSNAGGSRVNGGEFEADVAVLRGFNVRASATYLDSVYTKYMNAPSSTPDLINGGSTPIVGGIDAAGNQTPLASKYTFNLGADYTLGTEQGDIIFTVDLYHNSGYYFEPDNVLHQPFYDLLNSQIRWKINKNYSVRVFGRNMLNEKIVAGAASYQGPVGYAYVPSPPATWGVGLDVNF